MRNNSNATARRSRQELLSTLPRPMNAREDDKIQAVMAKIDAAVDGVDMDDLAHALCFFLISIIQESYGMSRRDSVDFCAECIRRFGQTTMS